MADVDRSPHVPSESSVPSSPDRPRLRPVPDFRRVNGADIARHKSLARNAYLAARAAQPLPVAYVDRLWAGTLAATEAAPPQVAAKMLRRSETLLRLLCDWHGWPRP
jgi:hypothetical protein